MIYCAICTIRRSYVIPAKNIVYGGVGEIRGNKILLEDKNTRIMLDFMDCFLDWGQTTVSCWNERSYDKIRDYFM